MNHINYKNPLEFSNNKYPLWQSSEKLLNFGQKSYKVIAINGNHIQLESAIANRSLVSTVLKAIICCTIALPLTIAAAITKAIYRKQYTFTIIDNVKENDKVTYVIDNVIAKIINAKNQGQKVGVFLGRMNNQTLPNQQGWEWFSLNYSSDSSAKQERHLAIDFNDKTQMAKIKGLFNKAVVDWSTIKFFKDAWSTLHDILENKPDSELITESYCGSRYFDPAITKPQYDAKKLTLTLPQTESNLRQPKAFYPELMEEIKKYVKANYFNEIKLHHGPHPYRTGKEAIEIDYFVIRSPK